MPIVLFSKLWDPFVSQGHFCVLEPSANGDECERKLASKGCGVYL